MMNWGFVFQLFALVVSLVVLGLLIGYYVRNPDTNEPQQINNKVNLLYILEIVSVSLMVLFALFSAVMYYRSK
jgi:hypothetical protein